MRRLGVSLVELLVLLLLLALIFGGLPVYPYSRDWGYGPSGLFFLILVIVLVVVLLRGRGGDASI